MEEILFLQILREFKHSLVYPQRFIDNYFW